MAVKSMWSEFGGGGGPGDQTQGLHMFSKGSVSELHASPRCGVYKDPVPSFCPVWYHLLRVRSDKVFIRLTSRFPESTSFLKLQIQVLVGFPGTQISHIKTKSVISALATIFCPPS